MKHSDMSWKHVLSTKQRAPGNQSRFPALAARNTRKRPTAINQHAPPCRKGARSKVKSVKSSVLYLLQKMQNHLFPTQSVTYTLRESVSQQKFTFDFAQSLERRRRSIQLNTFQKWRFTERPLFPREKKCEAQKEAKRHQFGPRFLPILRSI